MTITATIQMSKQKIYVLGAGAVGCYFGGMLARAGCDVTLIARPKRVKAINQYGLQMDCQSFQEHVTLNASSDAALLGDADLILLSVKSYDTEKTIQEIAPFIAGKTIFLSLQNGVGNVPSISRLISNPVYPAVVYVAAGMGDERTLKHHGRGELHIGQYGDLSPIDENNLQGIGNLFNNSGVHCVVSRNIQKDLWLKFLVNCAYNAISAIGQIEYAKMVQVPQVNQLIEGITSECLSIAKKEGVDISVAEATKANELIAQTMATQKSSTGQDLVRHKHTEIDYLNGFIVSKGMEHRIPTPSNQAVYALIKMVEKFNPWQGAS